MESIKNKFYIDVLKATLALCLLFCGARFSGGGIALLVALMGVAFAVKRKVGYLAICYILFPVLLNFNHAIVKFDALLVFSARTGNFLLMLVMILFGNRHSREGVSFFWLFAYCGVAFLSSMGGWMPFISYMKLIQFVLFIIGISVIMKGMQDDGSGLYHVRCFMMGLAIIFILGGIAVRFVPSLGYSMMLDKFDSFGLDVTAGELMQSEGMVLFNGMVCHSQMLSPVTAMMAAWVLCDMILVEKRLALLHMGVLMVAPVLIYMSRSRGGLLEIVAVMGMVMFVCVPKARLSDRVKSRLWGLVIFMGIGLISIAVVSEIKNQTISRWVRKTENVVGDSRTLREAFTESRKGALEYNLNDFKLNPIFGKGFQVFPDFERRYQRGEITWYFAPVEKGVTPLVVLGETGLLGTTFFLIFLISFAVTCLKQRYLALLTMFTCMFVCNLADSTFFSPSGLGGLLWITSCVGGFSIDLISIRMAQGMWSCPERVGYGGRVYGV